MDAAGHDSYEVRALTPDGTPLRVGPLRSAIDVGVLAHRYLVEGRAVRVELYRSRGGHGECFGVLDQQGAHWPERTGQQDAA